MALAKTQATYRLIEQFLIDLDCPRSLAVLIMFRENEHDQLLALDIRIEDYLDTQSFRAAYLATKFLSKATFLSTSVDKKQIAIDKFLETEGRCRLVNQDNFRTSYLKNSRFEWIHNGSIRKIGFILGDFSADEFADSANWGPGVTLKIKRDTSSANKFRLENGVTRSLHHFMANFIALAYPSWDLTKVEYFPGNKIVTVPKNSKTDRTIAIEPGINLWFQKSIGLMIRRRLLRVGVDLNSQTRNQQLAKMASKYNHLTTVDFSNASDSISKATVEALLPLRWHRLMETLRSPFGLLDSSLIYYEKFSSMGNGFTFELESLIFYAIAVSVCEYLHLDTKDISVFGDDVILPSKAYQLFTEITEIYGFQVNIQKSFSSGDFRESCGSHYFRGIDCKPYFLKEVINSPLRVYLAANSVRRLAMTGLTFGCDKTFERSWQFLRYSTGLIKNKPCLISDGYGDGGFIVNFDEATPSRARHGIEGYLTLTTLTIPLGYQADDHALLLARLKGRSVEMSFGNKIHLRGRVKILRKKILIRQWAFLGPWI